MTVLSQKEGVHKATLAVCKKANVEIFDGVDKDEDGITTKIHWQEKLTKEHRQMVYMAVAQALHDGKIVLSDGAREKYNSVAKLHKGYVKGLVSNWLRKDLRLNGGNPHQIKDKGSRAGQGDKKLTELKKVLNHPQISAEQKVKVEAMIAKRKDELAKEKSPEINWDALKDCDLGFKLD